MPLNSSLSISRLRHLSIVVFATLALLSNLAWSLETLSEANSLDSVYKQLVERRSQQIQRLHQYSARGRFPRNTDFAGKSVPYFVDEFDTHCAVGFLVHRDERDDIVESVVRTDNHVEIDGLLDNHRQEELRAFAPLVSWIESSGLTIDECAMIQPSYPEIEYFREYDQWRDERKRLQNHFANVQSVLSQQSNKSLTASMRKYVDNLSRAQPDHPSLKLDQLKKALQSPESIVRIAAAHAVARKESSPFELIEILAANLVDVDSNVRFWTAAAMENICASDRVKYLWRHKIRVHHKTLPVFLQTFRGKNPQLRLAALIQLTDVAPECIASDRQLTVVPQIRQLVVEACGDEDRQIKSCAEQVLRSWRWRRMVEESRRMETQYFAETQKIERLASELDLLDLVFADGSPATDELAQQSQFGTRGQSLLPVGGPDAIPIANTESEARDLVEAYYRRAFKKTLETKEPFWKVVAVESDSMELYYLVHVQRLDHNISVQFVVPRSSMLSHVNSHPNRWYAPEPWTQNQELPFQPFVVKLREDIEIQLGSAARRDPRAFLATCDLLARFSWPAPQVVRSMTETQDRFVWTAQFGIMHSTPRFFEPGGGGGWQFFRLTINCERASGNVQLSLRPVDVERKRVARSADEWKTKELKLMGWEVSKSLEPLNSTLLPPEYLNAIQTFLKGGKANEESACRALWSANYVNAQLIQADYVRGLLYEKTRQPDRAKAAMISAANDGRHEPRTLTMIANWSHEKGYIELAHKYAKAVLKLTPENESMKKLLAAKRKNPEKK